jgi:NDP-sugar pyrophosphorylase family protein
MSESDYSKITVMILGAGLGTRLSSITVNMPKVMVPIAPNLPLLEHTIKLLKGQGFINFIINLHYLPEKITSYFKDGEHLGVNIRYSDETELLLNTAGAIKKAEPFLSDPFLLLYGDGAHFLDFRPILKFHQEKNSILTPILKESDNLQNVDIGEIDPSTKRIVNWYFRPHNIHELSSTIFANSGLYVISKKVLDFIPPNEPSILDSQIIPTLFQSGHELYGFSSPVDILDIGSPERYEFAKKWYEEQIKKSK